MTLIESIASIVAKYYPHIIYIDDIGEDFERPSFYIYHISEQDTAYNRFTYNEDILIQIVYFSARDEHNLIISKEDQQLVINTLKHKLMTEPAIQYNIDDWGKLLSTTVGYTGDKDIFLQLKLDTTIGTRQDYDEAHPTTLMGDIRINSTN